jgi:hypothetical protein
MMPVRGVQRALLDLHWVENWRVGGQVLLVPQFLDGDYGPWTTETVLAYKRRYDIHFPPDAPTGTYDGFTGPATLKSLDRHCVLLDEADAAIREHADELIANGLSVEFTPADGAGRTTRPLRRSAGVERAATVGGEIAAIVYKRDVGAFELHGPVYLEWVKQEFADQTGDAMGVIGFPVSDMSVSDSVMSADFERGTISHNVTSGITTVNVDTARDVLRHEIEF